MTTYEKIKELCEKQGFAISSIGNIIPGLSVNKASITGWKNGSVPRPDKIKAIADYFGVTTEYLLDENASPETAFNTVFTVDNIFPMKTKKVPLLGDIACGVPIWAEEQRGEFVSVSDDIDADFCLRAKGDSMTGARIYDGDIVFIRRQPTVENGEIAAVIIDNEATLKRVYFYRDRNKLVLNPENPAYEPLVYIGSELEEIRILGKAVAFQSIVR